MGAGRGDNLWQDMLIQWKIFIPVQAINFTVTTLPPCPSCVSALVPRAGRLAASRAERIGLEAGRCGG